MTGWLLTCLLLPFFIIKVALPKTLRASTCVNTPSRTVQIAIARQCSYADYVFLKKKNNYLLWSIKSVCMHAGIRPCSSKQHRIKGQLLQLILFRDSTDGFFLT